VVGSKNFDIHFGGPDLPPQRLRDLLAQRVAAVPSGGAIDWVTYYFRDRRLAQELLNASRRGVRVTVTLDGRPRTEHANDAVIAMLSGPEGLGDGLRIISPAGIPTLDGKRLRPRLHTKLYCFSHPAPVAYIGSFNPSGDQPEKEPDVIRKIGDQDRGHNVLVGIHDPVLVQHLQAYAGWMFQTRHPLLQRFSRFANRPCRGEDTGIYFWPRMLRHPVMKLLNQIAPGARIRVAVSHLKGNAIAGALRGLADRGAELEIIAGATERRVPAAIEEKFTTAGVAFKRVGQADGLPMHNKFVIAEKNGQRWSIFGSFNWNTRSYWLNHEIGAISTNRQLWEAFAERWKAMINQADSS
jgi:phosphatidylserine/phosphatidylglycerophosphate/cardiolipin synthase-like enzyme